MPRAYYNENNPFVAAWLRVLIEFGLIAPGYVDERSIEDVKPTDLVGYTQCHFFAGIGVWSYALRCTGWPDSRRIWTGSCPCQPFSQGGKGKGFADERHLWPAWFHLITQYNRISKQEPVVIVGEQVASKNGLAWFDLVSSDLEGEDYPCGAVDSCSAGFGAPHIRQRLYWLAYPKRNGRGERYNMESNGRKNDPQQARMGGESFRLVDAIGSRLEGFTGNGGNGNEPGRLGTNTTGPIATSSNACRLDNSLVDRRREGRNDDREHDGEQFDAARDVINPGPVNGFWRSADWLYCRDGKWRPTQSLTESLADGLAHRLGYSRFGDLFSLNPLKDSEKEDMRVGRLSGYGNGLNAVHATEFIKSILEWEKSP